jgi:hypothetical protein
MALTVTLSAGVEVFIYVALVLLLRNMSHFRNDGMVPGGWVVLCCSSYTCSRVIIKQHSASRARDGAWLSLAIFY